MINAEVNLCSTNKRYELHKLFELAYTTRTKTTSLCERTVSPEIKWIIMSDNLNY